MIICYNPILLFRTCILFYRALILSYHALILSGLLFNVNNFFCLSYRVTVRTTYVIFLQSYHIVSCINHTLVYCSIVRYSYSTVRKSYHIVR